MKRLIAGVTAACLAAGVIVVQASSICALCAIYTPDDPQWYFFMCYFCPAVSAVFA